MTGDRVRQAANVVFAIAQVIMVPLLGSGDIGAVSRRSPTYVVPAGYAFAIWSLIFALSLAYAVYQALPAQRENPLLCRVGWFTATAFLASALWEVAFPRGLFWVSVGLIVLCLVSNTLVVARTLPALPRLTGAERVLVRVTFSIYLGWITVATVANVAQTLSASGWSASSPGAPTWGVAILVVAGVIASAVTWATRANVAYALTVVWALTAGVVGQRSGENPLSTDATWMTAAGAAVLVAGVAFYGLASRRATEGTERGAV